MIILDSGPRVIGRSRRDSPQWDLQVCSASPHQPVWVQLEGDHLRDSQTVFLLVPLEIWRNHFTKCMFTQRPADMTHHHVTITPAKIFFSLQPDRVKLDGDVFRDSQTVFILVSFWEMEESQFTKCMFTQRPTDVTRPNGTLTPAKITFTLQPIWVQLKGDVLQASLADFTFSPFGDMEESLHKMYVHSEASRHDPPPCDHHAC